MAERSTEIDVTAEAIAWSVSGDDDRSVAFAARLMESGVQVRIIDKATELSGNRCHEARSS